MQLNIQTLFSRVVVSIAVTAAVSAGSTLIKTADAVAVLKSQRVDDAQRLERIERKLDHLVEKADEPSHR
jgi:hypothetical protein